MPKYSFETVPPLGPTVPVTGPGFGGAASAPVPLPASLGAGGFTGAPHSLPFGSHTAVGSPLAEVAYVHVVPSWHMYCPDGQGLAQKVSPSNWAHTPPPAQSLSITHETHVPTSVPASAPASESVVAMLCDVVHACASRSRSGAAMAAACMVRT
jgi:hypothetical protein